MGAYLSYYFKLIFLPLGCASIPLGLVDSFFEFEELPPMPPVATVGYSGTLYFLGQVGVLVWGGGLHLSVRGFNPYLIPKLG